MASMKWVKPTAATLGYFERIAPGAPLETRPMFGMPSRFLNGHMLVGVFQNSLVLHLGKADRALCIAAGAKPFAPMGREMKEYVEIVPGTFQDLELKEWIVRGMRFLAGLKPKGKRNIAPTTNGAARVALNKLSKKLKAAKAAKPAKKAKSVQAPSGKATAKKAKSVARRPAKRAVKKAARKKASKRPASQRRSKR
jgi:TfoX/Sxy family transcriptional regulator of competence genes